MNDPTLFTLVGAYPDQDWDAHNLNEAVERGTERAAAAIPPRYVEATVTNAEVAAWVRSLADATVASMRGYVPAVAGGPSLLLLGRTGVGKTHEAYGAIRAISVSGMNCSWLATTAADVYAKLRPRQGVDSEAEFLRYANARLLVLDDLGAAKSSEWTEEVNYRLINHRYERGLPTIVTSNLLARQLSDAVGERVWSRLSEMCQRVVLEGNDRRRYKDAA